MPGYEDELQHADIAAGGANVNSQGQFNSSSSGIDPYQYNNYLAAINQQRRLMGVPPMALSPYLLGPNVLPYRSSQVGSSSAMPFVSNVNGSELSSFHLYPNRSSLIDRTSVVERANNARELELKIIGQTLKRSKVEQIDEINKSFKWEMDALRQECSAETDGQIAQEVC